MTEFCRTIGSAQLWLGDSLEIMAANHDLFAQDVNMALFDPPYLLTSGGMTDGGMHERIGGGGPYDNGGNLFEGDLPDWTEFMPLVYACMGRGHIYAMTNNRHLANCENAALASGFRLHNWLVWDKRTATANRYYMKNLEFIFFGFKGDAIQLNNCSSKQLIYCPQVDETTHPTEKPVPLMEHYIRNSSQLGQTVFDPFMGSGTTGVAALNLGRKFIGIERDPKYFDIACRRIEMAVKQPKNFLI